MTKRDEITLTRGVFYGLAAILFAGVLAALLDCATARADTLATVHVRLVVEPAADTGERVLPREQWTARAHLWLARAFVAEAGWTAERDHAAIAWTLKRRWERAVRRWPTIRFVDVVRAYCAGLGEWSPRVTRRQRWVRGLSWGGDRPPGWPLKASWGEHAGYWRAALDRAAAWQLGMVADPCRGKSWHWAGMLIESDRERADKAVREGRWRRVDCGHTRNVFFGLGR